MEDDEYGGAAVWEYTKLIRGSLKLYPALRYSSTPVQGGTRWALVMYPDRENFKWRDYHIERAGEKLIVAKAGPPDMPARKWRRLFLNGCKSGPYFYDVFSHATLFFTHIEPPASSTTTSRFIRCITDGYTNVQTREFLNRDRTAGAAHDFWQFR
jgi:hypothetical protein